MPDVFMKWEPAFSLGIAEIDEQHKKIVDSINDLNTAVLNQQTEEKIEEIINELAEYAGYHFQTEEKYFRKHHFPLLEEHVSLHQSFIDKVLDFKAKHLAGQSVTFRLLKFLKTWLSNHILDADREYVDLIKSEINLK